MAGDPKANSKRKRHDAGRSDLGPPSKRTSLASGTSAAAEDDQEHARKLIKAVYKRYNLLLGPQSAGQESAFEALLDSCEGEHPAVRRLAARLVPRFAARFPGKLETAARALMDLSTWDGGRPQLAKPGNAESTRLDALQGLGVICVAAAPRSADSRTASSIILHLFRRLQQCKSRSKGRCQHPWADGNGSSSIAAEQERIRAALSTILLGAPRAMLSACLEFLGYGSGELFDAAKDTVATFLSGGSGKKNGAVTEEPHRESLLLRAVEEDPKLAGWLASAVDASPGRARDMEVSSLLEGLSSAAATRSPLSPVAARSSPLAARTPEEKLPRATPKPALHERTPHWGNSSTPAPRAGSSLEGGGEQQHTLEENGSAEVSRVPARGVASAVPSRVLENASAMPRVESGELQGDPDGRHPALSSAEPAATEFVVDANTPLTELPCPGGPCAVVSPCLWIGGIMTSMVDEPRLRRECEEFAPVKLAMILPPPVREQALVIFQDMSHAAACYEGLNGEVRLSRKPLQVQFCEDSREVVGRPNCPQRVHVWACLHSREEGKVDTLLQSLVKDGVPQPKNVLRVGGSMPGAVLEFETAAAAAAAAKALLPRVYRSPSRRRQSPFRNRSPPPRSRSHSRGVSPTRPRRSDLPEYATNTLWIGQVGPDVDEQDLISSFERYGKLVGYKLLRGSNCGFIDFARVEQAAAAREALHNATFGSCEIRVEFKEEGRALGRLPGAFPGRGGGGRFGRGRGRGRFDGFNHRPGFVDSPSRGYRERDSPRRGRSRSPTRRLSPSPERSPMRRRDSFRRQPSPEASRHSRQSRRHAKSESARQQWPGAARASSRWDSSGPPPVTEALPLASTNGIAPTDVSLRLGQPSPSVAGSAGPEAGAAPLHLWPGSPAAMSGRPQLPHATPSSAELLAGGSQSCREGTPQATPSWAGTLAKSGAVVCTLQCFEGPRSGAGGANGMEPLSWPPMLNVTLRSDINGVLRNLSGLTHHAAAVRSLVLGSDSGGQEAQNRFKEFCSYLTGRNRAGVVENVPPAGGLPKRMIYLIPASEAIAKGLGVSWTPCECMLWALVVPSSS